MNLVTCFYVLEEDYLVGHGPTEEAALAHADATAATEASQDGNVEIAEVPRVVFSAMASAETHAQLTSGYSAASALHAA